jgi:preprotein translocase subunit YajC
LPTDGDDVAIPGATAIVAAFAPPRPTIEETGMFISPAYAQQGAGGSGFDPMMFLPIILIFVVFWFLLIRPQQKKMKDHQAMLEALRRGDRVVTGGGIIGTITRVSQDNTELTVEIAENVKVKVLRSTVSTVLSKTEPAAAGRAPGKPAEDGEKKDNSLLGKLGLK